MPQYDEIKKGRTTKRFPTTPEQHGNVYGSDESGLSDIFLVLDKWQLGTQDLIDDLVALSNAFSDEEIQAQILDRTFEEATKLVRQNLLEIIMSHIKEAAIRSVEYNYSPYLSRLQSAVSSHINEIVRFIPKRDGNDEITVGFSSLGDIEDWVNAVEATRGLLNVANSDNMNFRSMFWKDSVYGTGREGIKISRSYKKSNSTVDVTDKYSGLYDITIALRLGFIPNDKAPFWSLLLHGNSKFRGVGDSGGTAYPSFKGYDFQTGIANDITKIFREYYGNLADKFEEEYRRRKGRDFEYEFTKKDIVGILDDIINKRIERIDREEVYKEKGQKTIVREEFGGLERQVFITRGGNIGHRTFEIGNDNKKKQIKNSLVAGR